MRVLIDTALALALLGIPQQAFSDVFSDGVEKALLEYFDVDDAKTLAAKIAADPQFKGGQSAGAAADGFARLLEDKTPQKLTELGVQSARRSSSELGNGEQAFNRHLRLAAIEALKIIDGRRTPANPRTNEDGDFLNDFADTYSQLVSNRLDEIREAREEQRQETLFARSPQSAPKKPIEREDPLGKPHQKKPRKKRLPAPEEIEGAKHWARHGNATPRQVEDWLIDLNSAGDSKADRELREQAGRSLMEVFAAAPESRDGILSEATSKDISAASRWKKFGLKEAGYKTLRELHDLQKEDDTEELRRLAYASTPSSAARDELLRRVNAEPATDPLGAAMRSDFKNIRPELLLSQQTDVTGSDAEAAKALAILLGASNSHQLNELQKLEAARASGDEQTARYTERLACAAALSLEARNAGTSDKKACAPVADFERVFRESLGKERERYKLYQNWIEAAKNPERLGAARAWMLDKSKSGYSHENLMDRLGERVLSAQDARLSVEERQAAHDEALVLAKILGHQDPGTSEWALDLIARDAGLSPDAATSQTLILGKDDDEIFAALARFARRDTANHQVNTRTQFGARNRFQSFDRDSRRHAEHLADKNTRVYYAPAGKDKENELGLGTVASGRPTHIGERARLLPSGLTPSKPPSNGGRRPASGDLKERVEGVLASSSCTGCHTPKSLDELADFLQDEGLEGTMSSGPSIGAVLAGDDEALTTLREFMDSL